MVIVLLDLRKYMLKILVKPYQIVLLEADDYKFKTFLKTSESFVLKKKATGLL